MNIHRVRLRAVKVDSGARVRLMASNLCGGVRVIRVRVFNVR